MGIWYPPMNVPLPVLQDWLYSTVAQISTGGHQPWIKHM